MARDIVKLKLVRKESARKVTFKKRRHGLLKKMEELITLCSIDGFMIIFIGQETVPIIWPSRERAMELLARFRSLPVMEQEAKKVSHEMFMQQRVDKLHEHIEKRLKKNQEIRASLILHMLTTKGKTIEDLNIDEVELLRWYSEVKLSEINRQRLLLPPIGLSLQASSGSDQMPHPPPPPQNSLSPNPLVVKPPPPPPPPSSTLYQPPFVMDPAPSTAVYQPQFAMEHPPPPPDSTLYPSQFVMEHPLPPDSAVYPSQFVMEPLPPPPSTFYPPPYVMDPLPPMANQGMFDGGNAQNGENLMMVGNNQYFMNMLEFGNDGGVGTSGGMWPGESSNADQQNNYAWFRGYF